MSSAPESSQPTPATEDVVLELISGSFKKYTDAKKKETAANDTQEQSSPESNQPVPDTEDEEDVVLEIISGSLFKKTKKNSDAKDKEDSKNERSVRGGGSPEGIVVDEEETGTMGTDKSAAPDVASEQTLETKGSPVAEDKVAFATEADMEILRASSLRRDQRAPVAPGAVRYYPNGRTPSTDLMFDEEQQPTEAGTLDESSARTQDTQHVVPDATAVNEAPLVHAELQQWLDASDDKTSRWCSRRKMIVGGFVLLLVIGVIITVAVVTNRGSSASTEIQLVTLAPSMVASSSPSLAFETTLAELIRLRSPETNLTSNPALDWMLNDIYSMDVLEGNDDRLIQRFALATVWFTFGLDESFERRFEGWMQPTTECEWGLDSTLKCNPSGDVVVELDLSYSGASASIPTEISLLSSLRSFSLYVNSLVGTIPSELSLLTSMTSMVLKNNFFTGTIPSEVWTMTNLQHLSIGDNFAMSPSKIPSTVAALTQLTHLDLYGSQKSGSIPTEIGSLTTLEFLGIASTDNVLTGSIPTNLFMLTQLTLLDLGTNAFSSTFPTELGLLTKLTMLHVPNCGLRGTLPTELGNLRELVHLNLGWNGGLEGTIPSHIYALTQLTRLAIGDAGFLGGLMSPSPIMTEIGLLSNLNELDLTGNNLTGTIPTILASLHDLIRLSLASNLLTGSIRSELSSLSQLNYLSIATNNIVGSIPLEIAWLTNLQVLDLSENFGVSGTLMTEIGLLLELENLVLRSNSHTGALPTELGLLTKLTQLALLNNRFSGSLPTELANLTQLWDGLYLQANDLTGSVPDSVCEVAFAIVVDCDEIECACCQC